MKNIAIIITLVSLPFLWLQAQDNKKADKAEKYYQKKGYGKYTEALGKEDVMDLNPETLLKMAESYRKTGDTKNAEELYSILVEANAAPITHFHYAQMLHANGKYREAKKEYLIYNESLSAEGDKADQRPKMLADACDKVLQFRAVGEIEIKNESILNGPRLDFSPSFYKDGIVFVSTRGPQYSDKMDKWINDNFMDLYYAAYDDAGNLGEPKLFAKELSTKLHEGPVTFTEDGEKIYFTRNNFFKGKRGMSKDKITKLKIYSARKLNGNWTDVKELYFNSNELDVCHPTVSPDGKTFIFASNRPDGYGGMDLYVSYLVANRWTSPENLGPEINTAGNEAFPFLHHDGNLFYASDGLAGLGGLDVFMAIPLLKDKKAKWSIPLNMGAPFNSHYDDFGFIINRKEDAGFFSSNREGGKGQDDIYSFTLKDGFNNIKPSPLKKMEICVFDMATNERIEGAEVVIKRADANYTASVKPDQKNLLNQMDGNSVVLQLTPTKQGSDEYLIRIHELNGAKKDLEYVNVTNEDGVFDYYLNAGKPYVFEVTKDGYVYKVESFTLPVGTDTEEFCIGMDLRNPGFAGNDERGNPLNPTNPNKQNPNNANSNPNNKNNPISRPANYDGPWLSGVVLNKDYNRPLPTSDVVLINRCTGEEQALVLDKSAAFAIALECGCDYVIKAKKDNFIGYNRIINLSDSAVNCKETISMDLLLTPGFDKLGNPITIGGNTINESLKEGDVIELKNIYYDYDKYTIRKEAAQDLDDLILLMKTFPSMEIELSSHTDSRGTTEYNEKLSSSRANAAKKYLVRTGGIASSRIKAVGYGESRLRNHCKKWVECSEYEHQRNRRTEVFITKFDQSEYIKVYYKNNEPTVISPKK